MHLLRPVAAALSAAALLLGLAACAPSGSTAEQASAAADAQFPVTVEHAMGQTTIPSKPLRVVALDPSYVDATLLLGAELVGYVEYRSSGTGQLPSYLGDVSAKAGNAVNLGTISEPNLEQIIALKPDLIVSAKVRQEALYPQLSQIAPTVFSTSTGPTWRENVVLLGEALGKKAEAEAAVAAYQARAAAVGADIMAKHPDLTATLIRFAGEDTIRLYSSASFIGGILEDMSVPRPAGAPDTKDSIFVPISQEQILSVDAGLMLLSSWAPNTPEGDATRATRAQFESNPLWGRLTGKTMDVDDQVFLSSVSIQGANAAITVLAEHFGVDPRLSA